MGEEQNQPFQLPFTASRVPCAIALCGPALLSAVHWFVFAATRGPHSGEVSAALLVCFILVLASSHRSSGTVLAKGSSGVTKTINFVDDQEVPIRSLSLLWAAVRPR